MKPITNPQLYLDLIHVEDLLEREGWIKGKLGSSEGRCLMGAVTDVCMQKKDGSELSERWNDLSRAIGIGLSGAGVVAFNDDPGTTFEDVRAVLRKARESTR